MSLARMQQFITAGAILGAVLWVVVVVKAGHLGWAMAGAALLLFGYAGVLALEFALLYRLHSAQDPTPRATVRQLLDAWWGEVLRAPQVFCWQMPFRSKRWPNRLPENASSMHGQGQFSARRGVLLVHGFVCNRGIWNFWLARLATQKTPVVAVNLEPVFAPIEAYVDSIERAVQELEKTTGRPPVVVTHSMGGLALRQWWAKPNNLCRLQHVITLGTPHQGTWLARFALSPNARQMRPQSPWLITLASQEARSMTTRLTCFYSNCDNIVFPPANATVPGADNRHLPGMAHVHMVQSAEPWAELQHQLNQP